MRAAEAATSCGAASAVRQRADWLEQNFGDETRAAASRAGLDHRLIFAIAIQETGYIWGPLLSRELSVPDLLEVCVSDIIDSRSRYPRKAFPRDKAEMLGAPDGAAMFDVGRSALINLARYDRNFEVYASDRYPEKFCRGYGIYQFDLQHYRADQSFFLEKKWRSHAECLSRLMAELDEKRRSYFSGSSSLSRDDQVRLAIAYNGGDPHRARRFKAGYRDENGVYYGEHIDRITACLGWSA
jgi:hypothetical protein